MMAPPHPPKMGPTQTNAQGPKSVNPTLVESVKVLAIGEGQGSRNFLVL